MRLTCTIVPSSPCQNPTSYCLCNTSLVPRHDRATSHDQANSRAVRASDRPACIAFTNCRSGLVVRRPLRVRGTRGSFPAFPSGITPVSSTLVLQWQICSGAIGSVLRLVRQVSICTVTVRNGNANLRFLCSGGSAYSCLSRSAHGTDLRCWLGVTQQAKTHSALAGLVVKASASRSDLGSILARAVDHFPDRVIPVT